ncbi:MAG: sigma-70 family RNA polymerase sigma factor [Candidatus Omnitrophica bacterium]|nr:sigma-70 family RNA polymerase sigma factor [Candidatus Omnitrophota bacterium]
MDIPGNKELVKRCVSGDHEAWSEFVDRYSGLIYWAIRRKLYKYDNAYMVSDIEEIYQRVFSSIWERKSLESVSERDNISPWLAILASNITIDFIKRRNFEENLLVRDHEVADRCQFDDHDNEQIRLLGEAMKLLNGREKACFRLSYGSGKKHHEIAKIFNISVTSVSVMISRARKKIKRYIEQKNKKSM